MIRTLAKLLPLALLLLQPPGFCSEPPPHETAPERLSLQECVASALAHNLELELERTNSLLELAAWRTERGTFDPRLELSADYRDAESVRTPLERLSHLDGPETQTTTYGAALAGTLPTGTTWRLGSDAYNTESSSTMFASSWDSTTGFSLSQPLLRNAGTGAQLANLRIRRLGKKAADAAFEFRLARIITDVSLAYHELLYTRAALSASSDSLALAQRLLKDNQSRVEVGVMSPLDITQARSETALRQEEVIRAQRTVLDTENRLKRLIYADITPHLTTRLEPADTPGDPPPSEPHTSLLDALKTRSDLRESEQRLAQAGIRLAHAQNQLLPTLDLRGTFDLLGLDDSVGQSLREGGNARDRAWSVGVVVSIPLGLQAERGRRDTARIEQQRAILDHKRLEQDILVAVDNAVGAVRTNQQRVEAARAACKLARETLEAETEKLGAGSSTTYTVAQLQRDYAVSLRNQLRAITDWHQSYAELAFVQGQSLSLFHITFAPSPSAP
jgi:outer membrane protein TolC